MFCVNCGKEVSEGQLFCSGCGTKITVIDENSQTPTNIMPSDSRNNVYVTETKPVLTDEKKIEDKYIWPLVFTPLLTYLFAFIMFKMGIVDSLTVEIVAIVFNTVFLCLDVKYLESLGEKPGKWALLGIIIVPLYLVIRANKTNKNYIPFFIELALLIGSFFVPNTIQRNEAELSAGKQMISNIEKTYFEPSGYHISNATYDTDKNTVTVEARSDSGLTDRVTIYYSERWEGKNIYVNAIDIGLK